MANFHTLYKRTQQKVGTLWDRQAWSLGRNNDNIKHTKTDGVFIDTKGSKDIW